MSDGMENRGPVTEDSKQETPSAKETTAHAGPLASLWGPGMTVGGFLVLCVFLYLSFDMLKGAVDSGKPELKLSLYGVNENYYERTYKFQVYNPSTNTVWIERVEVTAFSLDKEGRVATVNKYLAPKTSHIASVTYDEHFGYAGALHGTVLVQVWDGKQCLKWVRFHPDR